MLFPNRIKAAKLQSRLREVTDDGTVAVGAGAAGGSAGAGCSGVAGAAGGAGAGAAGGVAGSSASGSGEAFLNAAVTPLGALVNVFAGKKRRLDE